MAKALSEQNLTLPANHTTPLELGDNLNFSMDELEALAAIENALTLESKPLSYLRPPTAGSTEIIREYRVIGEEVEEMMSPGIHSVVEVDDGSGSGDDRDGTHQLQDDDDADKDILQEVTLPRDASTATNNSKSSSRQLSLEDFSDLSDLEL